MDAPDTTEAQIRDHIRDMCSKVLPGYVFINATMLNNTNRNPIHDDEIIKSGQQYYKEKRPDL